MQTKPVSIDVTKELSDFIIPLGQGEFQQLEQNIIEEGCRDPLIVWENGNKNILVDGHNRYKICKKHGVAFKTKKMSFRDVDEVKAWMVNNQLGRRNLNPDQLSYYRGVKYINIRKAKGGFDNVKSKGQNNSTAEKLSGKYNVSESTIKRDAKFAEGLLAIARSNPVLKNKILSGEVIVKKADIQIFAQHANPEKLTIRNEADLYNKAKKLREDILDEVESKLNGFERERIEKARKVLEEKEPVMGNQKDRLQKIKGMIISAINKAITSKDVDAIKELKKLIDRLENELF